MIDKNKIVNMAKKQGEVTSSQVSAAFKISRQYASRIISELVREGLLRKLGSTRSAKYVPRDDKSKAKKSHQVLYSKKIQNKNVEEHLILEDIKQNVAEFKKLPENVASIFEYAFLEMLNNAIEHSNSKIIFCEVFKSDNELFFIVNDFGIGVFKNIMTGRGLNSELEAIGELMKGKITTAPSLHSGEGIFFTSKAGDRFLLKSFNLEMIVDNLLPDVFIDELDQKINGTRVEFYINLKSPKHLENIFKKYSTSSESGTSKFDKTEIKVRLFALGGVYISRSQARRLLFGLDKFNKIVMDYDKVPMVGQAFADEVYRVFKNSHPNIQIINTNMRESVAFMVNRAINS